MHRLSISPPKIDEIPAPLKFAIVTAPYQLRRDYQRYDQATTQGRAHHLFQARQEPGNFNPDYLSRLRAESTQALLEQPEDDQLMFELAFTILQNRPEIADVVTAQKWISKIRASRIHHPGDVESLRQLSEGMRLRLSGEQPTIVVEKINWAVTNKCPMVCRGCYHPFTNSVITAQEALGIANKLINHGSKYVVLSGGDPLLWDPIYDLVDYLNSNGIKVAVDTTGFSLLADDSRLPRLASAVTLLRVPLDGSTDSVYRAFRQTLHSNPVDQIRSLLKKCENFGPRWVTLHTVVSGRNVSDLENIAEIAASYSCVNELVLFQWCDRRANRKLIQEMSVDEYRVLGEVEKIRESFPDLSVYFSSCGSRALINFFIQSDGQVVTFGPGWGEELIVGNILKQDITTICNQGGLDHSAIRLGLIGGLSDH